MNAVVIDCNRCENTATVPAGSAAGRIFIVCPVCGAESAVATDAGTLAPFTVVSHRGNFYVFDTNAGKMLTQFAHGTQADAQADADRRNPAHPQHFEGRCDDCDARRISRLTLGQVEDQYRVGRVSQDQFEGYLYARDLLRFGGAAQATVIPAVMRFARKLIAALAA